MKKVIGRLLGVVLFLLAITILFPSFGLLDGIFSGFFPPPPQEFDFFLAPPRSLSAIIIYTVIGLALIIGGTWMIQQALKFLK